MDIASYIDHTLLRQDATIKQIEQLCEEAVQFGFKGVCVPPVYVSKTKELLNNTGVLIVTVIGFPLGYNSHESKFFEIERAIEDGADELDVVHHVGSVKDKQWQIIENEFSSYTKYIHDAEKIIKVIVESGSLSEEELIKCCEIYGRCGIDFMKTSTGFSGSGATVEAVKMMKQYLPKHISIKASGGIRNFTYAKELIDAGADRIGCSASIEIVNGSKEH